MYDNINIKRYPKKIVTHKKYFVNSQKYFFIFLLNNLSKFIIDTLEHIGYINIKLKDINNIMTTYQYIKNNQKKFSKNELTKHIDYTQEMIHYFTSNLDTNKTNIFNLIKTSNRLHKEIYDFKHDTQTPTLIDIKKTFEEIINNNIKVENKNLENRFKNSYIKIATSIIDNHKFSFNKLKDIYPQSDDEKLNYINKEIIDIKSSLENKRENLNNEISKHIENFNELFIETKATPILANNILDTKLIKQRKDAIKTLLRA